MLPIQCRMARTALNLGVRDLAAIAQVSTNTITRFEALDREGAGAGHELKPRTIDAIRAALEAAGITFLDDGEVSPGPGVALRQVEAVRS